MELGIDYYNGMQVVPGELTIITGVPNSGKSEWIDALMVNLADKFGWRFGLCSMEKKVSHLAALWAIALCGCCQILHLVIGSAPTCKSSAKL